MSTPTLKGYYSELVVMLNKAKAEYTWQEIIYTNALITALYDMAKIDNDKAESVPTIYGNEIGYQEIGSERHSRNSYATRVATRYLESIDEILALAMRLGMNIRDLTAILVQGDYYIGRHNSSTIKGNLWRIRLDMLRYIVKSNPVTE